MASDAVSLADTTSAADVAATTAPFRVKIVTRDEIAGCPAWEASFADLRKDHRYYEILEDTLRERVEYRYFAIIDEASCLHAVQPFFFSTRTFSKDLERNGSRCWRAFEASFPGFSKCEP
ncbi:hypothetical protein [Bradyrhizobium sp. BR 1433]|uniref:hypothetical protein n=1 Tax=Bradyrhizobium sp. BR 1433 TaxID=3447967 RepID=UPI003EE61D7F